MSDHHVHRLIGPVFVSSFSLIFCFFDFTISLPVNPKSLLDDYSLQFLLKISNWKVGTGPPTFPRSGTTLFSLDPLLTKCLSLVSHSLSRSSTFGPAQGLWRITRFSSITRFSRTPTISIRNGTKSTVYVSTYVKTFEYLNMGILERKVLHV